MPEVAVLARKMLPKPAPRAAQPPADGLVDLPPGKIAAVATYLEMTAPPPAHGTRHGPLLGRTVRLAGDLARYRRLYAEIGEPWLWFSRALLTDASLRATLDHPDVEVWILVHGGRDVGLAELDFREKGECELAFFGLAPALQGRGWSRAFVAEAVRRAFVRKVSRVWLHTCTLDHPAAIHLYLKAGFRPYRRAIEIADDPRLAGHLPRDAAPQFPIL